VGGLGAGGGGGGGGGGRGPGAGVAGPGAGWPRGKLWLGLGGAVLAFGFTCWNMDLAARAELAIARQEAGAFLLALAPPPVAESENAARVYAEATKNLDVPIRKPWQDAAYRGLDAREHADWKDRYVVGWVKKHEGALALLRQAAAMPRCNLERQRSFLDAITDSGLQVSRFPRGAATLLAVDARVKATQGNLERAFADVAAMLGVVRHVSGHSRLACP